VDEKPHEAMRQTQTIRTVADTSENAMRHGRMSPMLAAEAIVRALRFSGEAVKRG
jgi:hypothetical protein